MTRLGILKKNGEKVKERDMWGDTRDFVLTKGLFERKVVRATLLDAETKTTQKKAKPVINSANENKHREDWYYHIMHNTPEEEEVFLWEKNGVFYKIYADAKRELFFVGKGREERICFTEDFQVFKIDKVILKSTPHRFALMVMKHRTKVRFANTLKKYDIY